MGASCGGYGAHRTCGMHRRERPVRRAGARAATLPAGRAAGQMRAGRGRARGAGASRATLPAMRPRRLHPTIPLLAAMLLAAATRAAAAPSQFVPVDDPIVAELRVLDLYAPGPARGLVRLPHLSTGPWQIRELG